jgi:hypothetical protein
MSNILNITDIVDAIKKIEQSCNIGGHDRTRNTDHKKFYEQVKGLMSLVEVNLNNKKVCGSMHS